MTRGPTEPALGHELAREIATADRIDAIVAFVTVGGVRAIKDALERFSRREGACLRRLTTTFTATTEVAALDLLSRLPGARVKISYDTRRTRLHAKAWLFHRNTGVTTAYIGSANLTSTALGAGHEWMVKVCAGDLSHVIDQFAGTVDTLWEDSEFEPYSAEDPAMRARLRAALSVEAGGKPEPGNFLIALRPLPFQSEILDQLEAERAIHQSHAGDRPIAITWRLATPMPATLYERYASLKPGWPARSRNRSPVRALAFRARSFSWRGS